jgi:23S rRNA (uracil1939-C5)-methyltransferase
MSATFRIDRLGAQGDGVAMTETGPVFVRFALPGETVTAARQKDRAELIALVERSPQRIEPPCRHFGTCGGCALQHLEMGAYNAWKRDKVVDALKGRGIEAPVADIVPCAPQTRRRVVLAARRTEAGMLLGYYEAQSHRIVGIAECPIARPEIVARLGELRGLAAILATGSTPFRLTVTSTDSGLDVAVEEAGRLADAARLKASGFVQRAGFARFSVEGEVIVEPKKPVLMFGDVAVEPPPGAFLQATVEAEGAMADLVTGHLHGARQVADLFAGSGTFALRLAKGAAVHAVESEPAPLAALDRAARFATGLRTVTTERRDLFRRPLTMKELDRFDGLVFDPPRAGAEDQSRQIARSSIPKVAAVSCNPVTLARDLSILTEGGYRVVSVTPIDQFLWSPHVEAVALLEKPKRRR